MQTLLTLIDDVFIHFFFPFIPFKLVCEGNVSVMLCLKESKDVNIVPASGLGNPGLPCRYFDASTLSLCPGTKDKYLETRMGRCFLNLPTPRNSGPGQPSHTHYQSLTHLDSRNWVHHLDSHHRFSRVFSRFSD